MLSRGEQDALAEERDQQLICAASTIVACPGAMAALRSDLLTIAKTESSNTNVDRDEEECEMHLKIEHSNADERRSNYIKLSGPAARELIEKIDEQCDLKSIAVLLIGAGLRAPYLRLLACADRCCESRRVVEEHLQCAERARERLILGHLWLAMKAARTKRPQQAQDAFQYGILGLCHAADLYSTTRESSFRAYAALWIHQSISRAYFENERIIRLPTYLEEAGKKITEAIRKMSWSGTISPTVGHISEVAHVPYSQVEAFMNAPRKAVSLESVQDHAHEMRRDEKSPEEVYWSKKTRQQLTPLLMELDARSERIIRARFGIACEPRTLEEIAAVYDITRERVRQIEVRALAKLQKLGGELRP